MRRHDDTIWDVILIILGWSIAFGIFLGTAGCASVDPEVREYELGILQENYDMCLRAYKQAGEPFTHMDHTHSDDRIQGLPAMFALRSDLAWNNCRMVLGKYWAE